MKIRIPLLILAVVIAVLVLSGCGAYNHNEIDCVAKNKRFEVDVYVYRVKGASDETEQAISSQVCYDAYVAVGQHK